MVVALLIEGALYRSAAKHANGVLSLCRLCNALAGSATLGSARPRYSNET